MPYIEQQRVQFDGHINKLSETISNEGQLCYCIYAILVRYCNKYQAKGSLKFNILAQCISAIECAKLEFYRRIVAPYEDKKIKENGDIE